MAAKILASNPCISCSNKSAYRSACNSVYGQGILHLPQTCYSNKLEMYRKKGEKLLIPFVAKDIGKLRSKEEELGMDDQKSKVYSHSMTKAMGIDLTYRHEVGMNYSFVLPNLIVGSCLQGPSDVDQLRSAGVRTIFCLQQDPDLAYFGVDISAIQRHAEEANGIEHIRAPIRDFDPFDLRVCLPNVIAKLHKAVQRNGGITYVHCTAGLGRAPSVALTYMYWLLGYKLNDANAMLQNVRPSFPKLEAIRNATCDMLIEGNKKTVVLEWKKGAPKSVEISGLDIGWGQLAFTYSKSRGSWTLSRDLPVGRFEYKYIVDGDWLCNPDEPMTKVNIDGHVNNYVEVLSDSGDQDIRIFRERLMAENSHLNNEDRRTMLGKLAAVGGA